MHPKESAEEFHARYEILHTINCDYGCCLPSPLLPRLGSIAQLVFEQIDAHPLHVLFDVFFPVERLHVEVEEFLIVGIHVAPKLLHIVIRKSPFIGAEETDDVGELVDLFVSF